MRGERPPRRTATVSAWAAKFQGPQYCTCAWGVWWWRQRVCCLRWRHICWGSMVSYQQQHKLQWSTLPHRNGRGVGPSVPEGNGHKVVESHAPAGPAAVAAELAGLVSQARKARGAAANARKIQTAHGRVAVWMCGCTHSNLMTSISAPDYAEQNGFELPCSASEYLMNAAAPNTPIFTADKESD